MIRLTALIFVFISAASFVLADESPKAQGCMFLDEGQERAGTMMIFPEKYQYGNDENAYRAEFV